MANIKEVAPFLETNTATTPTTAKTLPKSAIVLDLLHRDQGATLTELVQATSWQPHTTRAALTGLRQKGHTIERLKRDKISCYFLRKPEA